MNERGKQGAADSAVEAVQSSIFYCVCFVLEQQKENINRRPAAPLI